MTKLKGDIRIPSEKIEPEKDSTSSACERDDVRERERKCERETATDLRRVRERRGVRER